ncbi:MAG: GTP-binding protein TypA [Gammaproteobacteria bacterium RBG_16_51_14]|nr:MAG: GTP-binding protein TypA [Gammaproteobacteria bacterium RBG_16_51_14]
MLEYIRNIAIIAHVDHGKTTLVDQLLRQSGTLKSRSSLPDRIMDSNELEQERGITILAKNTGLEWGKYRINIIDTPGHADFGGEVERILSMADSALLLVDAVDGPMPQTRFVTQKALEHGFRPIIVINKIDRDGARPAWVLDQTFDLIDRLGASNEQLDFHVVYTSALNGSSGLSLQTVQNNMDALFETIVAHVSPPDVDADGPFQMQISTLDYNSYQGVIGIGRITRGKIVANTPVSILDRHSQSRAGRILQIFRLLGLERIAIEEAYAGDIVAITGIDELDISDTLCDPEHKEALPPLIVDEPTVSMTFQVNDSPLCGREGRYVTSRHILSRLQRELKHNVALHVEETGDSDKFIVSGRGELHLSILIETMRREGYELGVSRPDVIRKRINDQVHEPYELLSVDLDKQYQGAAMELLGEQGGDIKAMSPDGKGRVRLDYLIPARGLIGIRTEFLTATSGTGLLHHVFDHYGPVCRNITNNRENGVLISKGNGKSVAYALFGLQERGQLLIGPGSEVYEGMVIGIHSRGNDLVVNPLKAKQLTNIRAAGKDDNILLTPPVKLTLEQALGFINDDELVEITPGNIRIRKKLLKEHERKRAARTSEELAC